MADDENNNSPTSTNGNEYSPSNAARQGDNYHEVASDEGLDSYERDRRDRNTEGEGKVNPNGERKPAASGKSSGDDPARKEMQAVFEGFDQLKSALKPYKIILITDKDGKPELDKNGKLQGTVSLNGVPIEDEDKEALLKAEALKRALEKKMKTKEGMDYSMNNSVTDFAKEMGSAFFADENNLDGGLAKPLVNSIAAAYKHVDLLDPDSKFRQGFRAGEKGNLEEIIFDGKPSDEKARTTKELIENLKGAGLGGMSDIKGYAEAIGQIRYNVNAGRDKNNPNPNLLQQNLGVNIPGGQLHNPLTIPGKSGPGGKTI